LENADVVFLSQATDFAVQHVLGNMALAFSRVLTALGKSWHRYQHLNRKSRWSWCFSFIEGDF
jgi:hypothetical protein